MNEVKQTIVRAVALVVRVWRYLEAKSIEAAEIQNRATTMTDERYQRHWYHMRGLV